MFTQACYLYLTPTRPRPRPHEANPNPKSAYNMLEVLPGCPLCPGRGASLAGLCGSSATASMQGQMRYDTPPVRTLSTSTDLHTNRYIISDIIIQSNIVNITNIPVLLDI